MHQYLCCSTLLSAYYMLAETVHFVTEFARSVVFLAHAVYLISGLLVLVMLESDFRVMKAVSRYTL